MGSIGWQELVIVLVIVIIIFGAGKLPEIGGALGKGIKEFKTESGDIDKLDDGTTTSTTTATTTGRIEEPKVVEKREMRPDEI